MSRRHRAEKRIVKPDAQYGSVVITKFINVMMVSGKKSIAESIVYGAFEIVSKKLNDGRGGIEIFDEVIENLKPTSEVKSKRVGGATYQVPVVVGPNRAFRLAVQWLKKAASARAEKRMRERLAAEMLEAINKRGSAYKMREDTLRMAKANEAFASFANAG